MYNWILNSYRPILASLALLSALASSAQTPVFSEGTEFWLAFMQNGYGAQTREVIISAEQATTGMVEAPIQGWSQTFSIPAGGLVAVTVPAALENQGSEIISDKGIFITASDTINVHAASTQSYTGDVTSILPLANLGNDYIISAGQGLPGFANFYKSEFTIVSIADNSIIEIVPTDTTAAGRLPGIPFTVTLNRGESYQVQALGAHMDLTGSLVRNAPGNDACKPFAVFAGSMCANVPNTGCTACDHIFQQMTPTNKWGTRYFTFNPDLINEYAYRIVAKDNGTNVLIDGVPAFTLGAGQWHEVTAATNAHCIESNGPISVYQIFKGYTCAGTGDPSLLALNTDEQLLYYTKFKTAGSNQISAHRLALISEMSTAGNISVDGSLVGSAAFTPLASCSNFGVAYLNVTAGNHAISAPQGAIAYPYGIGTGESYLFSAGTSAPTNLPMSDTAFCQSGQIDLVAPPHLIDPYWTLQATPNTIISSGQQLTISPSQSDIYVAWGNQFVSGCLTSQNYYVELNAPSATTVTAVPATLCSNGQTQLNVGVATPPTGMQINWSPGNLLNDSTIANPTATISESTWFYVTIQSVTGCSKSTDSVLIEVAYPKLIDLSVSTSNDSICAGSNTTLDAVIEQEIIGDGFGIFNPTLWNTISGGVNSTDCGSVFGNALYFNDAGTREAQTNAFDLSNGGNLRFQLKIATGVAPCDNADPGEDVVVEYSTNGGGVWNTWPGSTLDEASYPAFTLVDLPIPAAAYSTTTSFRISQPNHSGLGQDNWAIDDLSITAFSSNNLTLAWKQAATVANPNSATTLATPTTSGWYTLDVSNNITGCLISDSVFVSVGENFVLALNNDTSLCDINPVQLNAIPSAGLGHTYSWSPNNGTLSSTTSASPIANTAVTQTYTVNANSVHGCSASANMTITVDDVQSVSISASDSALCAGQSTNLMATIVGTSSGLSYDWTPNAIMNNSAIQNPVASPQNNTTVAVTVTDIASGCTYTDNLPIAVVNLNLDLGPDTIICDANGLILNAAHTAPNPSYTWNGGANLNANNIQSPTVLLNQSNTYSVTLNDAAGCSATDQITVTVPFDNLNPIPDATLCDGDSVLLDATHSNSSYLWNGTNANPAIWVNSNGLQTVQLTDLSAGCQTTYDVNVTVNPKPIISLGNDTTLCAGQTLTLDASNVGSNYLWSTNAQTQTITISTAGIYWVEVENANNCSSRDSIEVFIEQVPVINLNDSTLCMGETLALDATWAGASNYAWSTSANTPSISVSTSNTYDVTVTTPAGCNASASAFIDFVSFPVVNLGPDTTLCAGQPLSLNAANPGLDFTWNTNSTAQVINPSNTGIYWVDVANGSCVSRDSIAVVFNALPTDNLVDANGCEGDQVSLDAGNPGSTYDWNTTAVSQTIDVSTSGTYTVTVTNPLNCSATFDAVVNFEAPPVVNLGNDTTLCEGQQLILNTGYPGADNDWSTGAISESITVSTQDLYQVEVSTQYCTATDSIRVNFNPSPVPVTPKELRTCLDEAPGYVVIDAGNSGSAFDWSTGEQSQVILAGAYGWYFVNITNNFDCARSDSVEVIEFCPSSIFVPNSFTPNGDGVNDIFLAVGTNIVELEMFIFDRWGNMIFHSEDPNIGWDGNYQGRPVKDEVYSWRIRYKLLNETDHTMTGVQQESLGHVMVIR